MVNPPGPRTSPTVKPLATMNGRTMRTWELRLGPLQIVILLGLVLGTMPCAYLLGLHTGHRAGFEEASDKNLKDGPKQPIFDADASDNDNTGGRGPDLFAKLNEKNPGAGNAEPPKLGVIGSAPAERVPVEKVTPEKEKIELA